MPARPNLYALSTQMNDYFNTLMGDFNTEFGNSQAIFNDLSGTLSTIVKAGPQQYGFSAAEDAALRTMATENAATATERASALASERAAAAGGGNALIPSSVESQIQGGIAEKGLQELGREQLGITEAGYERGLKEFEFATGALEALPKATSADTGLAGEAIGAGKTAFIQSSELKANEGGIGKMIGGLAGGLLGSIAGPIGTSIGSKLGSAIGGAASGGDFVDVTPSYLPTGGDTGDGGSGGE